MTLLTADDYLRFPHIEPDHRYAYGAHDLQVGELTLPETAPPHPVIVLIHGGGYREIYDLRPMGTVVAALAAGGFARLEYRISALWQRRRISNHVPRCRRRDRFPALKSLSHIILISAAS